MKRTPLYDAMVAAGGKMVDFAGFEMPVQFSGIINEHMRVRESVGLFDVSHMGEILVTGKDSLKFVDFLVTNKVSKMSTNQVVYSPMCYENGTCVDDLLVYKFNDEKFLLVVNASNTDKDFSHIKKISETFSVEVINLSDNYAQIAVQGPDAIRVVAKLTKEDLDELSFYWFKEAIVAEKKVILSRTGYTGEDGFEIYTDSKDALDMWKALMEAGEEYNILPCGLGARDTLRFENKLVLYGHELDEETTPVEARLNWAIDWESDFMGKASLLKEKENGLKKKLIGFEMKKPGVPRQGYKIYVDDIEVGYVSSGCKAPFLNKFLGLGYIKPEFAKRGNQIYIQIRNKMIPAEIVKTPFYKKPALTVLNNSSKENHA